MDNQSRRKLIIGFCLIGAFAMGWFLATGNVFLTLAFLILFFFALIQKAHRVNPEALILSILLLGYIIGNRGFAQLNVGGFFVGELGMLAIFFFGLLHISAIKKLPYHIDPIGIVILLMVGYAIVHMVFDFPKYKIAALRDFATCYYAGFYFLVQPILKSPRSVSLVERSLIFGFGLMIPLYILFTQFPEFFLNHFLINNIPVIYYKFDLAACFLGCGFFLFFFQFYKTKNIAYAILAALSFLVMLSTTSRAAIPGFAAGTLLFFFAGLRTLPRFLITCLLFALIPFIYFLLASDTPLKESKAFALIEHGISMVDITGTYEYQNPESRDSGANNRYRLEWWRAVTNETWDKNPVFGLGFGYDLTSRFLDSYYGDSEMEFSVRSPHSIFLTFFGRLGLIGIMLFISIIYLLFSKILKELKASRKKNTISNELPYHAILIMILSSATFGVVLEGPMGAILFWSLLGLLSNKSFTRIQSE